MNMKRSLSVLLILFSLLLAACGGSAAPAAVESAGPTAVVQSFYEILNTGDVAKAMELTAEDYVMNDPFGTYDQPGAAIQWQAVVDAGLTFKQTNFVDTGNGRVTSCYEVFENGTSIDKGCGNVTHVRDGKIIFDGLAEAEQVWIVQEFYEAINAGDLEAAMAFVADDVKCRGACYLTGKDSFRNYIQGNIDLGGHVEISDFTVNGTEVTYTWVGYTEAGFFGARGTEKIQFQDGKILLFDTQAT
jgi:ketosteroid isomerase-like protein